MANKQELTSLIKKLAHQVFPEIQAKVDEPINFQYFELFPELKSIITDLLTDQYPLFIEDILWVAPRPSTFVVQLKNSEDFQLQYLGKDWVAKVTGKKYYLKNLDEEEMAAHAISRLLAQGITQNISEFDGAGAGAPAGEGGFGGGGGAGDFGSATGEAGDQAAFDDFDTGTDGVA